MGIFSNLERNEGIRKLKQEALTQLEAQKPQLDDDQYATLEEETYKKLRLAGAYEGSFVSGGVLQSVTPWKNLAKRLKEELKPVVFYIRRPNYAKWNKMPYVRDVEIAMLANRKDPHDENDVRWFDRKPTTDEKHAYEVLQRARGTGRVHGNLTLAQGIAVLREHGAYVDPDCIPAVGALSDAKASEENSHDGEYTLTVDEAARFAVGWYSKKDKTVAHHSIKSAISKACTDWQATDGTSGIMCIGNGKQRRVSPPGLELWLSRRRENGR